MGNQGISIEDTVFVLHVRHSSQAPLMDEEVDREEEV